jgi:hypothetical protein
MEYFDSHCTDISEILNRGLALKLICRFSFVTVWPKQQGTSLQDIFYGVAVRRGGGGEEQWCCRRIQEAVKWIFWRKKFDFLRTIYFVLLGKIKGHSIKDNDFFKSIIHAGAVPVITRPGHQKTSLRHWSYVNLCYYHAKLFFIWNKLKKRL